MTYVSDTMSQMTDNTNTPFPDVPWSDWQIDARDIQIVQRPNGKDWLLGGGAFGQVRCSRVSHRLRWCSVPLRCSNYLSLSGQSEVSLTCIPQSVEADCNLHMYVALWFAGTIASSAVDA